MAIIEETALTNVCSDAVLQKEAPLQLTDNGTWAISISFKGAYLGLLSFCQTLNRGDVLKLTSTAVSPLILQNALLRKECGTRGLLTLSCAPCTIASGASAPTPKLLKEIWSVKAVRNDISILAYCGPSEAANANRAAIEAWQKEPDPAVADQDKYTNAAGQQVELNPKSKDIVAKIRNGIDSVIRFYPLVTRKRFYNMEPSEVLQNLCEINTPPVPQVPSDIQKVPGGLYTTVTGNTFSWLKIDDSADESRDGSWVRIESWIGVSGRAWDQNLYGTGNNRWSMPY